MIVKSDKRGEDMILIQNAEFELVHDFKNGFNEEAFKARYSDILNKYDYIVGDWGYSQSWLKGFFDDQNQKQPLKRKSAHWTNTFTNTAISSARILF